MTSSDLHSVPKRSHAKAFRPGTRAARLIRHAAADGNRGPDEYDVSKMDEFLNLEDFIDKDEALTDFEKGSKAPPGGFFHQMYGRLWPPSAPTLAVWRHPTSA